MQYRNMTKDNIKVSQLGFGCMRFPTIGGDTENIDKNLSKEMVHYAIDHGVNYIDTAYPYHGGKSEAFVGEALKDGYRDKVYLASKSPSWLIEKHSDFEKYLDEQLENLQTDHIDFYLLHALSKERFENLVNLRVFDFLEEAKRKGKIKYAGFSFHDELDVFKRIVDSYPWDFCQIQLNYMDRDYQAGLEGLRYAKERDISVIIMEPIKGGKLSKASNEIQDIWNEWHEDRSPSEWALRWLYNLPELSLVLSGMSTIDHVVENVKTASSASPDSLSDKEIKLIDKVTNIYKKNIKVGCTACEYCLPCPQDVSIPDIFELYNNIYVYGTEEESKKSYQRMIELEKDVSKCVECGACESVCPQHLEIINFLKDAEGVLR